MGANCMMSWGQRAWTDECGRYVVLAAECMVRADCTTVFTARSQKRFFNLSAGPMDISNQP